jgi:hypothetical protein
VIGGMERLGSLAAELLELIETEEVREDSEISIGTVAIVVELNRTDPDGEGSDKILTRCTDLRRWVQEGLFDVARRAVAESTLQIDDEDDE